MILLAKSPSQIAFLGLKAKFRTSLEVTASGRILAFKKLSTKEIKVVTHLEFHSLKWVKFIFFEKAIKFERKPLI